MSNVRGFVIDSGILIKYRGRRGDVAIPEGVTQIGPQAFRNCTALTSVSIPKGVTEIGESAFEGCSALTTVSIPEGVTKIGKAAFESCSALTSVSIPEGVTKIGDFTFCNCTALETVSIPESVTEIGISAFDKCTNLTSVSIPESVTTIDYCAFINCPNLADQNGFVILGNQLFGYYGPGGTVTLPDSITQISGYAFSHCTTVTSVSIPEGVPKIRWSTFAHCTALTSISIPKSVTTIAPYAFQNCTSLTSVSIPEGMTKICSHSFSGCTALTTVSIPEGVTTVDKNSFHDCPSLNAIFIADPWILPAEYRSFAAVGFALENVSDNDPRCAGYYKLIKNNAKKWMAQAIANPDLLWLMCRQNLISAALMPAYEEAARSTGNIENIAVLLEYSANKLTAKEKKRAANRKFSVTNAVFERKIRRAQQVGIDGQVFAITGKLQTFQSRKELKAFLAERGGKLSDVISAKVDYLIMNDDSPDTEKKKKADELGIDVITEYRFNDLVGRSFVIRDGCLVEYRGAGGDVAIPEGVTQIDDGVFLQCTTLTSVSIPAGMTEISDYAFDRCTNLTSVSIPEGVTKIGFCAFFRCTALTTVSIPKSVTRIGMCAFDNSPGPTIHAPAGSYAEAYAKQNQIPFQAE